MVASVFENKASSSPSLIKLTIRSVKPRDFNSLSPFLSDLYIFSIVPNFEIRVVAVLSPIPLIPIILSDGSPLRPL